MVDFLEVLNPDQVQAVQKFTREVAAADGVYPFDEQTLLDIENPDAAAKYALIFRTLADAGEQFPALLGVAAANLRNNSMELAVHPSARRQGHGTALLALSKSIPDGTIWAHGNLPSALAFVQANELEPARQLLVMGRKITAPLSQISDVSQTNELPPSAGWRLDTFQPADLTELVALNARAFAEHPEQGQLTVADFEQRFRQKWFDPRLLFLLRSMKSAAAERAKLGGFVWLKPSPSSIELYVLGIDPAEQGQGLGGYLIQVALQAAQENGYQEIVLYVDAGNYPAVHSYEKAGFAVQERHTAFQIR